MLNFRINGNMTRILCEKSKTTIYDVMKKKKKAKTWIVGCNVILWEAFLG